MAEHVLPEHKPHDQLRTEAPKQRPHTDKYVSAFVTGKNVTELTFKNPILGESADHFKVGIDDLTVNLGSLSMLDYSDPTEVMFRIIRRGVTNHPATNADELSDGTERGFRMPDYILNGSVAEQEMTAHQRSRERGSRFPRETRSPCSNERANRSGITTCNVPRRLRVQGGPGFRESGGDHATLHVLMFFSHPPSCGGALHCAARRSSEMR